METDEEILLEPIAAPTVAVDEDKDKTTIPCKKTTRIRVKDLGKKGESYDHLINRKLDELEKLEKVKEYGK